MEAEKQQNTQNIFMASVGREAKIETVAPKESYPKTLLNWEVNKIMNDLQKRRPRCLLFCKTAKLK